MKKEEKDSILRRDIFSTLDIHFARLMERISGSNSPELSLAAALVSLNIREGNVCLDLTSIGGTRISGTEESTELLCPELNRWTTILRESNVVGNPGDFKPLILDDKARLYLFRYWNYEKICAEKIKARIKASRNSVDIPLLKSGLDRLFPEETADQDNLQRIAASRAVTMRFCVISGGPGTGKTYTVARILALLLEQADPKPLRIALAAPTGKAAARLQQTIQLSREQIRCPDHIKKCIPAATSTIHRLLGSVSGSPYFYYNEERPLPLDVMVVDEASMVDLALFAKLIQALPIEARLILVGDKDQLASVESGAVLGDICDTGKIHHFSSGLSEKESKSTPGTKESQSTPGMEECIIQLNRSFRFSPGSGIEAVSRAVNECQGDLALEMLIQGKYHDLKWRKLPSSNSLSSALQEILQDRFGSYLKQDSPEEAFSLFNQFRIICALRQGPYGSAAVNALVEKLLEQANLIEPRANFYAGRPVMITSNDYDLQLFNGDVGLVLQDPDSGGDLRVFFPQAEALRKIHPSRLPEHESVYAMTIHKSQGSEFDHALMILPDRDTPLLTRELIYTGLTRVRKSITLWSIEKIFRNAVARRIERTSGLRDALWGA